jgi:hypothetical protein
MSTSITKDALVDLTLQELLVRIIQTQTAKSIDDGLFADPNTPISSIRLHSSKFKRKHHAQNLSEKACMSTTSFIGFSKRIGHESHRICYQRKLKCAKQLLKTLQYK